MSETDHFDRLAEARYRKILESQPQYVWRRFSDGEQLRAHVFFPENHDKRQLASAALFFHGGMWRTTSEVEFVPWALQLKQLGIVSILPEYRTRHQYEVKASDILEDADEAWQWVYENAFNLGLSQRRIALVGSDAGGLMALHAGMTRQTVKWKWFRRKITVAPQPAAVVLFRGVSNIELNESKKLVVDLDPETVRKVNPVHRMRKRLPVLFSSHGEQDKLLGCSHARAFARQWKKYGNPVKFVPVPSADHTYYHFNVNAGRFEYVLSEWLEYMREAGVWEIEQTANDLLLT